MADDLQEAQQQLAGVKERAHKASEGAQRHQQAMAKLTADNLVLLLRLRQCEAGLAAATTERDALRLEVTEKRGPWFEEVSISSILQMKRCLVLYTNMILAGSA